MNVRHLLALAAVATTLDAPAQELAKLSLDDAAAASPLIEADATVKAEGASSLKITARWPVTVCLGEVTGLEVENATLVYAAKVKSQMDGTAYLEMWAHVAGGQYFSRGMNDVVSQTTDWRTIRAPFNFEAGQKPDKVTLNLVINGQGTVWIDDLILSKEPKP